MRAQAVVRRGTLWQAAAVFAFLTVSCVDGQPFAASDDFVQLSIAAALTEPTQLTDQLPSIDRVVVIAVALPDRIVGRFERSLTSDDDEIVVVLDVDLTAAASRIRVDVELWAADLVVYGGSATGSLNPTGSVATWTVDLSPMVPLLQVSPTRVELDVLRGDAFAPLIFEVTNAGGGTLDWTASADVDWVGLGAAAVGTTGGRLSAGVSSSLAVLVTSSDLALGGNRGTIRVSAPGAIRGEVEVEVRIEVDEPELHRLEVRGAGDGVGTVSAPAVGLECRIRDSKTSGACEVDVVGGTALALSAAPSPGSVFGGWEGDCTGLSACQLLLSDDVRATARFMAEAGGSGIVHVSPSGLSFVYFADIGGQDLRQSIDVTNASPDPVSLSVSADASWVDVGGDGSTLEPGESTTLDVRVSPKDLPLGAHAATVSISGHTVSVALEVRGPTSPGELIVETRDLSFESALGAAATPASRTISLRNAGAGQVDWLATADVGWLQLSRGGGQMAGGSSDDLTVQAVTESLAAGDYEGNVTVAGTDSDGNGAGSGVVRIRLRVDGTSNWTVSPLQIGVSAVAGAAAKPISSQVVIKNVGPAPLNWRASAGAAWLVVSESEGSLPVAGTTVLTVMVLPAGLGPGVYVEEVRIRSADDSSREFRVGITLTVGAS